MDLEIRSSSQESVIECMVECACNNSLGYPAAQPNHQYCLLLSTVRQASIVAALSFITISKNNHTNFTSHFAATHKREIRRHQTCLSINRLWHELCDMLRRLVGTTAPGHHDCSIQK
ncbi:hypothetical protein TNCV_3641691 [Trichonephila clavipes]|nr:hypothetical protein TNCV_3641691 [Trichonephila clavipes]